MRDSLYEYVRDTGRNIVNDAEKDKEQNTYVEPLLALKDKYDRLLAAAFTNDKQFQHSINQVYILTAVSLSLPSSSTDIYCSFFVPSSCSQSIP